MTCLGMLTLASVSAVAQATFDRATFTHIINDVSVVNSSNRSTKPAKVSQTVVSPNLVQTGGQGRAELKFPDNTVTRVGSNTLFSFSPGKRGINLQRGSILFHSPTGRGGGQIKTASVTASITGTTIMVATTSNGGFKLLVLEGTAKVRLPNGKSRKLKPGQMVFILPRADKIPAPIEFHLSRLVAGSKLVQSFPGALDSLRKINREIDRQEGRINSGRTEVTDYLIGDAPDDSTFIIIDENTLDTLFEIGSILSTFDFNRFNELVAMDDLTISTTEVPQDYIVTFSSERGLILNIAGQDLFITALDIVPAQAITIATSTLDIRNNSESGVYFFAAGPSGIVMPMNLEIKANSDQVVVFEAADGAVSIPLDFGYQFTGQTIIISTNDTITYDAGSGNSFFDAFGGEAIFRSNDNLSFTSSSTGGMNFNASQFTFEAANTLKFDMAGGPASFLSGVQDIRMEAESIFVRNVQFNTANVTFATGLGLFDVNGASLATPGKVTFRSGSNSAGGITINSAADVQTLIDNGQFKFEQR